MAKLPNLTQQPILYVDATPNEEYPLRILRAYRHFSDCQWAEDTDGGPVKNQLLKVMNKNNETRAKILDKAIKLLERG